MGGIISHPSSWTKVEGTCYELGHTWCPSCLQSSSGFFTHVFIESFTKIYLPLYLVGDIVRRRSLRMIIISTIPHALRSSLFLAINAGGFITFICLLRRLFGGFYLYSTSFLPSLFSSFIAILVERKSRRSLLMGYVGSIAVETVYRMLKYRDRVRPVPFGEVMIFSVALSVLYSFYKSSNGLHDAVGSLLSFLLRPSIPGVTSLWERAKSEGGVSKTLAPFLAHTLVTLGLSTQIYKHAAFLSVINGVVLLIISVLCVWGFTIGYSIQSVLNVIQLGDRIIRNPRRIKQALNKPYNRQLGAFLAALTGFFNVLNSILYILAVPRDIRISIAGLFAGLSMVFIRSTTISLYAASKAIELVFFKAVKNGYLNSYYYGDVVLYSIFTAIIFHAALFEAHNLRLSYWKFLNRISGGRIIQINYDVVDEFGTDSSQLIKIMRAQEQLERQRQRHSPEVETSSSNTLTEN